MSQSAENQSAIIENENNSNIVMESQAAMTGEGERMNVEDMLAAEAGPETPTQDEVEGSMDMEEDGRGDDQGGDGSAAAGGNEAELISDGGDAGQQSVVMDAHSDEVAVGIGAAGDALLEPQDGPEPQSPPPEEAGEQEKAAEAMEVEETEPEPCEPAEEGQSEQVCDPGQVEAEENADASQETAEGSIWEEEPSAPVSAEKEEADESALGNQEAPEMVPDGDDDQLEKEATPEEAEGDLAAAENVENADIQEVDQDEQAEAEQENAALAHSQAEGVEASVSAEDEDRLLAEDVGQSQEAVQDHIDDVPEITEDHQPDVADAPEVTEADPNIADATEVDDGQPADVSEVTPDLPEVVADEPEASEGQPEVMKDQPEAAKETDDAAEVVHDAPEAVTDAPEAAGDDVKTVPEVVESDSHIDAAAEFVEDGPENKVDSAAGVCDLPEVGEDVQQKAADNEEKAQEVVDVEDEPELTEQSNGQPAATDSVADVQEPTSEAGSKEVGEGGDVSIVEAPEKHLDQTEDMDSAETQDTTEKPAEVAPAEDAGNAESKPADDSEKTEDDGSAQALDAEADRASDATIEEGRDIEDEPMLQVMDVKSGAEAESELVAEQDVEDLTADDTKKDSAADAPEAMETDAAGEAATVEASEAGDKKVSEDGARKLKSSETDAPAVPAPPDDDDDDVVVLDDDDETTPQVKKEAAEKELFNSNNDMGIQIESVSGGADELHELAEQQPVKQENGVEQKPSANATPVKREPQAGVTPVKKTPAKSQTCIVCKRVGKCKYNIVRNGDIKHLCDDTCFKRFRTNPTMFLKGAATASVSSPNAAPAAEKKGKGASKPAAVPPLVPAPPKATVPGYKTCVVCQLMNINTQGQFCMWKGLDFCGEGCLGKFQAGISTSCTLCTAFIPLTARSTNCLRLGTEVRPFCSSRCYADYKLRMRLCTFCQRDLSTASDSFSAPVGSEGSFKDFCSQPCMKKYEDLLSTDVEIIRVEPGKPRGVNKCSVCQKNEVIKHAVKYNGILNNLCSDPCLSAFQYANKLDMSACDFCGTLCTSLESSPHVVQFEGVQKRFCSDSCVTKFRFNHRKVTPCSWCGSQRDNFDMIERLDSNNKYQLFCSLNCLSLYRVNLQAKSNQAVTCDQCLKYTPAQYHLTMSDASVRNFCSYNCVMTFQAQFSKGAPPPPPPTPPPPKHKHNTRGRSGKGSQQAAASSPSFPIISNVVSLAPQGGQKVNIKNSTGAPVVVSGTGSMKTTGTPAQAGSLPVQQQIIIQPPPPKQVKNKSLLCKPFVQTKATSCRPHTQTKECQTDEVKDKPVLIPVPIPVYLPTPMALYTAPAPTPIFIPVPIPVPIFIPTTRKSASGIMKQIKEIQEKTPADPLEAEILMMAAAVSADGKNSSDSESEEEVLPEMSRPKKRSMAVDEDDDDADVMPLTNSKEEEGGEEDMISMALRMAEEMSGPIADLESAVEAVPINTEPPAPAPRAVTPEAIPQEEDLNMARTRRGTKRGGSTRRGAGRPPKRQRVQATQPEPMNAMRQEPVAPPAPPADANYHLKFTYGVNAWRHWVLFKNAQIERNAKPGSGRVKLFKTDIMQCTADELNFSLCLFVKEVRKPNGDEYSPDSIYYLTLGIQQYLFENGRIDNIFADLYYERFTECLTEILAKCQPKFNAAGQMVCRIEEEHLWECKQLGAHSPYVLLNTLIYFHTKYFMLKTPEDHMKLSFAHILKYWKKGQPGKGGQPTRSVSLRYYSVSTAKKDGSAPTSTTKKGSKEGIPVYEVTENQENPLRCPVKLYEFYLSKCPESIKNRSDIFYPVPERSCVPDSPVWYSTMPITLDVMTKMLTRILLVREIQEAHLHAQPIYV